MKTLIQYSLLIMFAVSMPVQARPASSADKELQVLAAALPLKAEELLVKRKDECYMRTHAIPFSSKSDFVNTDWGGGCVNGFAFGEGLIAPKHTYSAEIETQELRGWVFLGRPFGKYKGGMSGDTWFSWQGKGVQVPPAIPRWDSTTKATLLSEGEDFVRAWSGSCLIGKWGQLSDCTYTNKYDVFAVNTWSFKDGKVVNQQYHLCPDPRSPNGCENVWIQYAGPIIERINAFVAENSPKADALQQAIRQWSQSGTASPSYGDRAQITATCAELNTPTNQALVQSCAAHPGCRLVMDNQPSCTHAKTFLDKLSTLIAGKNKIESGDVFDAADFSVEGDASVRKISAQIKAKYDKTSNKQISSGTTKQGFTWVYEGAMQKGARNGTGVLITHFGSLSAEHTLIFRGEFVNGRQSGLGEMLIVGPHLMHRAGEYQDQRLEGKGAEIAADGSRYEGTYKAGLWNGEGTRVAPNIYSYTGGFLNGGFSGQGSYQSPKYNNQKYTGGFLNSSYSGKGHLYTENFKDTKDGEFREGKLFNGVNTLTDGSRAEHSNGINKTLQQQQEKSRVLAEESKRQDEENRIAQQKYAAAPSATSLNGEYIDVTLSNRWEHKYEHKLLRVSVATYDVIAANRKTCEKYGLEWFKKCELNAKYDVGSLTNPFRMGQNLYGDVPLECKYTPFTSQAHYANRKDRFETYEEQCGRMLQDAIHEDLETSVNAIRVGAGLLGSWKSVPAIPHTSSGNCQDDLAALNKESVAIRERKPSLELQSSIVGNAQLGMYLAANEIRVLESACKNNKAYSKINNLRKQAAELLRSCQSVAANESVCAPKLPW